MKHIFSNSNESAVARNSYRCATLALPLRKVFFTLSLLLTLSVGQMWAEPWLCRSTNGGNIATKTVGDKLNNGNEWNYTYTTNGGWSSESDIQVLVGISTSSYTSVNAGWVSDGDGSNKNVAANIGNVTFDKSGKWYAVGKYKSGSTTAYTTTNNSWTNNTTLAFGSNSEPYWTVNPPAVSSFTVTPSGDGYVSGSGTEGDPYIMNCAGGNMTLTLSGSKAQTDANSRLEYKSGSNAWNTTTTRTIYAANASTTAASLTLKMRCYNTSASLSGAESSITIWYKKENSGSVSVSVTPSAGGSASRTPSSMGYYSGGTITATANTGYDFTRWDVTTGSGTIGSATTASTTFKPSTSSANVRATFTAKTINLTLDGNGGSDGSATIKYDANALTSISHASWAGHSLTGYWTEESGGDKVLESDGTLNNASGWVTGGYWKKATNGTLYAQWTVDVTNYTVTYAVKSDQTSLGTLSCATTVGSTPISSGGEVASGTGVTFTASPITGYEVDAWCSNEACTSPIAGAGYANTYSTTVSANTAVYVKFKKKIYTITYSPSSAPTGCTYTTKPTTGTYGNTVTMKFTPSTGYTVSVSAKDASSNTVTVTPGANNTYTFTQPASAVTVTVTATERKSTVTVTTATSSQGTLKFGATSKSWGTTASVGVATTQSITATAAAGFTFVRWDLSGAAATSSSTTSATITLKADGSGNTGTATAVFAEDLSSPWIVAGGNKIVTSGTTWRTTADANNSMVKQSGHSTESVVYFTVPVSATNTGASNGDYKFKIVNTSTTTWYGLAADGQYWVLRENDNGVTRNLSTSGADIELRADVVGDYLIKVDYSSDPTITVYFPLAVTWTASSVYSGDAATIAATVNDIESGKSLKYELFAGATATGDALATYNTTTTSTTDSHNFSVTPSFGANDMSKQYTVKITYNGTQTATYTDYVYRKWDIYVQDNCSWGNIYHYNWDGSGNEGLGSWPGTTSSVYSGSWHTITFDAKYPTAILHGNNNQQTNDITVDISTYSPGTFWNFSWTHDYDSKKYYNLSATVLSNPTVWLDGGSCEVINTNQLFLTGHISDYGGDGSAAADMIEVGFDVNGVKYPMNCKTGDDAAYFWGYVTGLTAGTTYTVKAYATNIYGTGESSGSSFTTRAAGTTTIKVRSAVGRTAPYIYAYTETDAGCNGTKTQNAAAPGVQMTKIITGTVYHWYEYEISNEFNKFRISENNSNQTDDWESPAEATCYWYHPTEATQGNRMGTMTCPSATPQLMINGGGASEEYTYHDMSSGGANQITKTLTLAAKTGYLFKPVYNAEWYGKASTNITRAANGETGLSASVEDNLYMTTDAAGDYIFTFNTSTKAITITYPAAHTITFGIGTINGSNSAITATASPSFSSGDYVLDATSVTFNKGTTKAGYTWKGWYSNDDGTGTCHSSTDANWTSAASTRTENISVYACYNVVNYTITYNLNGGANPGGAPTGFTVESSAVTLPTPTRTGYTFNGWFANSDLSTGGVQTTIAAGSTGNKTYWAKWTPKTTTITLNNVDATTPGTTEVTATFDATMPTITLPTKTGYTFGGYWGAPGGSGPQYYNADGSSAHNWDNENATYTLFAHWIAKSYTVTLDYDETNHGDITTTPPTSSVTADYGAEMPALAILPEATEGYGFMGYYSAAGGSGTQYYDGTGASVTNWNVDDNVTLYAYYKKAEITIELEEAIVAPWTAEDPSTVTATPTLSPRPEGDTKICWFLLQNNNNPVDPQPSFTPGEGNSVSFPAPTVSGNYKVVATLRTGTSCDGGTLLDADTVIFTVAGEHTVTILYKCGDDVIKASTTSPGKPLVGTSITAPDIIGYSFHHWVLGDGVTLASGTAGSAGSAGTATISYTAIYDGHITAVYTKKRLIYFNNTLGWSSVNVYFYKNNSYWNNDNGTGADQTYTFTDTPYSEGKHGAMTQIEGTNIWYFDAEAAGVNASYTNVVFTELDQHGYGYFAKTDDVKNKVIRRDDYKATTLPMFVPLAGVAAVNMNSSLAEYYNEGYWMNYPENTGYVLKIYNSKTYGTSDEMQSIPFEFTADKTMPMRLTVELNANREYGFEIHRADGTTYGNNTKVMKINDSGDSGSPWAATSGKRTGIQTSVAGNYIFTLSFGNNGGYNYLVGVHYPVAENDYRIVYNDRIKWSYDVAHTDSWHHPSRAIHKANGAQDTVSFYVSKADGASASMNFQYADDIDENGVVTWENVDGGTIDLSGITKSGVYNFILTQADGTISVAKIEPYSGAYYIRTDNAGASKWDNYRAADHQMTYSEFSKSRETNKFGDLFSHYFTKWCPRGTNIKFCVANDYSSCVSDTLIKDDAFDGSISDFDNVDEYGTLGNHGESDESSDPYSANIRFMYDESTNRIKRAYVAAATNVSKRFLVLVGKDDKLRDKEGNAIPATANLEANAVLFQDDQNWIYETTVKAIPGARIKIYANYLVGLPVAATQFFVGASGNWADENTIELLGGSGETPMLVRVIYDFKTNRLVCAWMPDGTDISGDNAINADIMVVREHQNAAQTITFKNDESKLSKVKTVYGAMKFNRWILNNRQNPNDINPDHCRADHLEEDLTNYHNVLTPGEQKSIYERSLYFISFPFRVKLSEVFGFGKYWDEWYIEYYDGLNRAKNGYWMDSPPNWKYVTPDMLNSFYLEPNVGYILGLDLDFMQAENTKFWANGICNVELYFPSQESIETIGRTAVTMPALGEEYICTINRSTAEGDRRVKDSYWRCIGVPGYSSYNNTLTVDGTNEFSWQTNTAWREDFKDYPFLYEWNMTDNTLTAQSTNRYNFKAMHAYLVQNGNEIHWSAISATPVSSIVARNRAASQTEYLWRLTMECDGQEEDQAFVRMTDEEDVTDGFDFGQDLAKEYNNARSDLYTYIGYERAAANSMPLHTEETTSIPVGVSIEKAGEYTFAMPDGTSGVGITLIDSETGARTNLSAGFTYTVNFEKGDYNNRLYLEISPVSQISTGVGAVSDQSSEIRKVVIDGLLYIVKDGQMYDATGKHCK